jgi:hypothetical protein
MQPRARDDSNEPRAANESADAAEQAEPIESSEPAEPIDPIESTEPTEPIDSTEPSLPIERIELSDLHDHRESTSRLYSCLSDPSSTASFLAEPRPPTRPLVRNRSRNVGFRQPPLNGRRMRRFV